MRSKVRKFRPKGIKKLINFTLRWKIKMSISFYRPFFIPSDPETFIFHYLLSIRCYSAIQRAIVKNEILQCHCGATRARMNTRFASGRGGELTASAILAYVKQTRLAGPDNGPIYVKVLGRLRKGRRCLFKAAGAKWITGAVEPWKRESERTR